MLKRLPFFRAASRCLRPLLPQYPDRIVRSYTRFWKSYFDYWKLAGQKPCALVDLDAQIGDWQSTTPISYYFYQDTWAFHKIVRHKPMFHVDIGSTALMVGCLAGVVRTISLDVRPLAARLDGLSSISGLITQLPFPDASIPSLSALCVLEHIGLGRYGDPLDPEGTAKAARELARVIAPGGDLYVSVPCGRSYIAFNAHRSFQKEEFVALFPGMTLEEYVLVNNQGVTSSMSQDPAAGLHVGLFHFRK